MMNAMMDPSLVAVTTTPTKNKAGMLTVRDDDDKWQVKHPPRRQRRQRQVSRRGVRQSQKAARHVRKSSRKEHAKPAPSRAQEENSFFSKDFTKPRDILPPPVRNDSSRAMTTPVKEKAAKAVHSTPRTSWLEVVGGKPKTLGHDKKNHRLTHVEETVTPIVKTTSTTDKVTSKVASKLKKLSLWQDPGVPSFIFVDPHNQHDGDQHISPLSKVSEVDDNLPCTVVAVLHHLDDEDVSSLLTDSVQPEHETLVDLDEPVFCWFDDVVARDYSPLTVGDDEYF